MVIKSDGADTVLVETDLPPCTWPFNQSPNLKFNVAADQGVDYVKKNFNIEPKVVERS